MNILLDVIESQERKKNKMTRTEQVMKSMKDISDLPSEDMQTVLLGEIALSLAVIVDLMIENQEKETK